MQTECQEKGEGVCVITPWRGCRGTGSEDEGWRQKERQMEDKSKEEKETRKKKAAQEKERQRQRSKRTEKERTPPGKSRLASRTTLYRVVVAKINKKRKINKRKENNKHTEYEVARV